MSLILSFKVFNKCVNSSYYTDILMQYFIKVIHIYSLKKLFPMIVQKKRERRENQHEYTANS